MLPTTQRTLHTHAHTHAHTHTSAVNSSGLVKDASASMKIHQMESLRPTFARECSHALTPSYHSPLAAQKEQWLEVMLLRGSATALHSLYLPTLAVMGICKSNHPLPLLQ